MVGFGGCAIAHDFDRGLPRAVEETQNRLNGFCASQMPVMYQMILPVFYFSTSFVTTWYGLQNRERVNNR